MNYTIYFGKLGGKKMKNCKTRFIIIKGNLECRTNLLGVVRILQRLGWKVKHNELSELI